MEISNKFLAFLLVITIVITIIGVWLSVDTVNKFALLTGYQVTEGNVTVNITERAEINVTQPDCAFGSGYVTAPASYAILSSGADCYSDPDVQDNWTNSTAYDPDCMEVRNDGNQNVSIKVASGKDAASMIGGTSSEYKVWSVEKESTTCFIGLLGSGPIGYPGTEMDTTNITLCSCVNPNNASDEIYAGCYLRIPDDTIGYKDDTWTFVGTASGGPDC